MGKRVLTADDHFALRQTLQFAVLDALAHSRRWAPKELAFQGGTCLHMVYKSPRFSEDLDFLVRNSVELRTLTDSFRRRILSEAENRPWFPRDLTLSFKDAKSENNPHAFEVALSGDKVIGKVRVKVELYQSPPKAMDQLTISVDQVAIPNGPLAGAGVTVANLPLEEIYYDKVFAIGARDYLKPRDVFDLHWLEAKLGRIPVPLDAMKTRCMLYRGLGLDQWQTRAAERLASLATAETRERIQNDLEKWLPSMYALSPGLVQAMTDSSIAALQAGVETIAELELLPGDACDPDSDFPRP